MIKIYGMPTCPDCVAVDQQAQNDPRFEIIDLGSHVLHLKAFLKLRDTPPAFDAVKKHGGIGIPCFVLRFCHFARSASLVPTERRDLRSAFSHFPLAQFLTARSSCP